ncbi:MerR family transcriptional regulator [Enterovibrio nigricans]|uniref:DNA-binding transcriptional regulator, MerR family n=1 Tax=Enterovibrio nigricans DSM 22720 TaxID=1121868 RepID=A0A1T4V021_9GAMM|nr:MerR family transcriptional regulator [Enterovibrio nigricans]SKA58265.1 DNA-binding transcriptional regulator, MerR family [Enterovibrio nigricans DSM 22720]
MYRISELGERVGLSRTTLLYYEKLGLIQGERLENGYRTYSERDLQRLRLIQQLQAGGLTLKECQACLEAKIDRTLLVNRLEQLDAEIAEKQRSRELLASLLGEDGQSDWHDQASKVAPDEHLAWLIKQGFNEKEALRLKWLSKNMNEHDQYMADFMHIFNALERWGPGSGSDTLRALKAVPFVPENLLEIGCGRGIATTVLAKNTNARITALDNETTALERTMERATDAGVATKIETICASMTDIPLEKGQFDLIWAEGCAYVMGVNNALKQWRSLLSENGVLVLSDMVWSVDSPSPDIAAFLGSEYPDITTAAVRIAQANAAGYDVIDTFTMSKDAWDAYYTPLGERVTELETSMANSAALKDIKREVALMTAHFGEVNYQLFILAKAK